MHPVLGINPPGAGTAQPSRGGRWSCPEDLFVCPHRCSTSDMPSAKARRTSVPWLPHAACLMLSPLIPSLPGTKKAGAGRTKPCKCLCQGSDSPCHHPLRTSALPEPGKGNTKSLSSGSSP